MVDRDGGILIRSQHRSSNRTFQNLFEIIDMQDNDIQEIEFFRTALKNGDKGVARFQYMSENYVFCYIPMEKTAGWYVISIVPDRVIMEQADSILRQSWILFLFILVSILVLAAFFVVYRDSTTRILRAEEARKAAESANTAKSRFLSNMSHDIRTPMSAVIGMTRLASNHIDEPEKVKEYLKNIRVSGQLLVGLTNDILNMSKIESGKMTLNNDNVSLVELMTELVSIVQPTVEQKKQNFNIRLHSIAHETLYFDALRLNQILINLLSNAMKFTPEGGCISVDLTESASPREGCARFTFCVEDTGIGMSLEFLKDLFTSFMREQDSRVNQIEGSGLGMAITKMLVELMGGTIKVESESGKGTLFTVELDLLLPEILPQEELQLPPMRILIADDDPLTCQAAAAFLQELKVVADTADSGTAALEKIIDISRDGGNYSLVLLDWRMPDMNGVQALRAIREQVGDDIPVVIFYAYDWTHIEAEAMEAGAAGFVQKPFFKSTLYRCIRKFVLNEMITASHQSELHDLAGIRILLAEDNLLNQEIAREWLTDFGAQVETVDNGLACVERFEQVETGYFDLILMDIHMPVMNGYETVSHIRKMSRQDAREIPILAMTADAFAEDIEAAKNSGMNGHLAKPIDLTAMLRESQRYLGPR